LERVDHAVVVTSPVCDDNATLYQSRRFGNPEMARRVVRNRVDPQHLVVLDDLDRNIYHFTNVCAREATARRTLG